MSDQTPCPHCNVTQAQLDSAERRERDPLTYHQPECPEHPARGWIAVENITQAMLDEWPVWQWKQWPTSVEGRAGFVTAWRVGETVGGMGGMRLRAGMPIGGYLRRGVEDASVSDEPSDDEPQVPLVPAQRQHPADDAREHDEPCNCEQSQQLQEEVNVLGIKLQGSQERARIVLAHFHERSDHESISAQVTLVCTTQRDCALELLSNMEDERDEALARIAVLEGALSVLGWPPRDEAIRLQEDLAHHQAGRDIRRLFRRAGITSADYPAGHGQAKG